jgi:FdhD protein
VRARRPGATTPTSTWEMGEAGAKQADDNLATEEPLEIRLVHGGRRYPVAVTMRTPGADFELAVGFLFTEGVLKSRAQLARVSYCVDKEVGEEQRFNIVNVDLAGPPFIPEAVDRATQRGLAHTPDVPDFARLERHFSMTSACGVCGKATLEDLRSRGYEPLAPGPPLRPAMLRSLPAKLRQAQALFETTGGLHASGLFSADGELLAVREDVGRHNAMDKVVGWAFLNGRLPLTGHVVLVSGRSSFELVQKSLSAGVAALCSVSAPSSLAVDLAREFGLTLVGFLREERFKVYSGAERAGVVN